MFGHRRFLETDTVVVPDIVRVARETLVANAEFIDAIAGSRTSPFPFQCVFECLVEEDSVRARRGVLTMHNSVLLKSMFGLATSDIVWLVLKVGRNNRQEE